ncbi:MAG: glycoside hydrolase family 95 protein [Chitinophagaceae bacterium]|nr:glycoside hydrolase family 95 protein [Chitinophagaceae bacterium]
MRKLPVILMLFLPFSSFAQDTTMKLWYTEPAGEKWVSALPLGNGRIGAMVYGNPAEEHIQLNESTVWTGSPNRNDNPDALQALPEIRRLIFEGKEKEAQELAKEKIQTRRSNGQIFQPAGDLFLSFPEHAAYTDYYRELDLATATTTTRYTAGGTTFTRKTFTSLKDGVMIVRLSADKAGALSFTVHMNTAQKATIHVSGNNELDLSGVTGGHEGVPGGVKFVTAVKVVNEGGTIKTADSALTVKKANSVTIYVSIGTNFVNYHNVGGNAAGRCRKFLAAALQKPYKQLLADHTRAYQKYFNRVSLQLGADSTHQPTDVRLQNFARADDPQFVSLYFQFGRYLLISCSQPGGQPANLQGIWNDRMDAPWDAKYTININTEMNYWPAEKDNLPEMHEPLIQMVKELAVTGRETARTMYGARGWLAHHNTDLWRITGPVDGIYWGMWTMGGAWLALHTWEKYLYSGDKIYLRGVYPALKGAALFFSDHLVEEPSHHWLVNCPGTSPENAPSIRPGVSITAGATMDNQIVFDLMSAVIRAAHLLHTDSAFADTLLARRQRLPPMQVGKYGQLQEWLEDLDNPNDHHRHISHLYGLFPSNQISPYRTPELFSAAHTTILERGDVSTGWSMGWKVNWWARFGDGDHALKLIRDQLSPVGTHKEGGGTYPNLFDAHPPFQIDGNFGCTSGITEMLVQSQDGALHLLPALPGEWKEGSIAGIRARGGFEVAFLQWKDGLPAKLVIRSTLGGNLRIRVPDKIKPVFDTLIRAATGENPNPFYATDEVPPALVAQGANVPPVSVAPTALYDRPTRPGEIFMIVFKPKE